MYNFEYYTPTKVVFGRGTEKQTAALTKAFGGSRVLIHYGGQSAVRSGLLDRIKKSLDDENIFHVELGGVVPNPELKMVYEGKKIAVENNVDFILAVGGGSVIDSCKAIGYALAEPQKDVWDLYDGKRAAKGCMPIGIVLTIAAAGSEMSFSSVITNEKTSEKRSYGSDLSRPKFAVMNPELTMTLPDYQTQAGCTDIMMHTMERYFNHGGNLEITDEIAEGLIRTVMKNALILRGNPTDYQARAEVMWCGSLSHNGLTECGSAGKDFATHALEHELGGFFGVTHGAGLAALWASWARYVCSSCPDRFVKFAKKVMGVDGSGKTDEEIILEGIAETENFFREIGMPTSMTELGVNPTDEEILAMAKSCFKACGYKPKGTAKGLIEEDFIEIYKSAR